MTDASPPLWTVVLPALRTECRHATLGGGDVTQPKVTIGQVRSCIEELKHQCAALEAAIRDAAVRLDEFEKMDRADIVLFLREHLTGDTNG